MHPLHSEFLSKCSVSGHTPPVALTVHFCEFTVFVDQALVVENTLPLGSHQSRRLQFPHDNLINGWLYPNRDSGVNMNSSAMVPEDKCTFDVSCKIDPGMLVLQLNGRGYIACEPLISRGAIVLRQ